MKVKAIRKGFYAGRIITEDSEFTVEESAFSEQWMEKLEEAKPEVKRGRKPKAKPEVVEVEGGE